MYFCEIEKGFAEKKMIKYFSVLLG